MDVGDKRLYSFRIQVQGIGMTEEMPKGEVSAIENNSFAADEVDKLRTTG